MILLKVGLLQSLARPGGNITGVTYVHDMLAGKSIELLKDTAPWVSRVAILWNPGHVDPEYRETQRASRLLDVQLQSGWLGRRDSNLCIAEPKFAKTLSPGGRTRTCASRIIRPQRDPISCATPTGFKLGQRQGLYSSLAPVAFISVPNRTESLAIRAAKSSGVPVATSAT
jgi:hypothetical protein